MEIAKTKSKDTSSRGVFGSPKKGGAGGKGTWGKGGLDDLITVKTDRKDPNYVSDDEEDVVLEAKHAPAPSTQAEIILRDFFIEADNAEAANRIKEEKVPASEFVRKAAYLSMERDAYERELVSKLLSALYGSTYSSAEFEEGFQIALDKLDDAVLDIPLAGEMLGKFIARAIVDEIVPPAFLKSCFAESSLAIGTVLLAAGLVNDPHRSRKLEHIWGPGALYSVKKLKHEVHNLIEEFLTTGDLAEADRCVRKLNAPHFHVQLVRYALRFSVEVKSDEESKKIINLLASLAKGGLIVPDHIDQGFKEFSDQIEDLKLDAPLAPSRFEAIVKRAQQDRWLSTEFK